MDSRTVKLHPVSIVWNKFIDITGCPQKKPTTNQSVKSGPSKEMARFHCHSIAVTLFNISVKFPRTKCSLSSNFRTLLPCIINVCKLLSQKVRVKRTILLQSIFHWLPRFPAVSLLFHYSNINRESLIRERVEINV